VPIVADGPPARCICRHPRQHRTRPNAAPVTPTRSAGTSGGGPEAAGEIMIEENPVQPLAIVIPVRNAGHLLPECLAAISEQLRAGDTLVVVDDASDDDTSAVAARLGAEVIRRRNPGGPYAARNDGWRATSQPYVLFTDARCVANQGLLDRVREAASHDPALIFADIVVRPGTRLAERVAAGRQHLRLEYYREDSFLRFFPTAGLTVKRAALDAVDGFRVLESGGDADLCWRIQLSGFRELHEIEEPLIEWRPRSDVRSLVGQWAKYGRSNAQLRHEYRSRGATAPEPQSTPRLIAIHTRRTLRALRRGRFRDASVVLVDAVVDLARDLSYARTLRGLRRDSLPAEP
jgi:glycosyltransferase involved in cell wall biosynthesis